MSSVEGADSPLENASARANRWRLVALSLSAALVAISVCYFLLASKHGPDSLSSVALALAAISISLQLVDYGYSKFRDLFDKGEATRAARELATFERSTLGHLEGIKETLGRVQTGPQGSTLARLPEALAGEEARIVTRVVQKIDEIAAEEERLAGASISISPASGRAWGQGTLVRHAVWGTGNVIRVDSNGSLEVLFDRSDVGKRLLLPQFVDLSED